MLGTSSPRQCGIATFSGDLLDALRAADPQLTLHGVAMSDRPNYRYPDHVCSEIAENVPLDYLIAAHLVNEETCDVLSVQHEYGIFGGPAGSHLLNLMRDVRMPIVTTLHTVLSDPNYFQKTVLDEVLQLSERVVVMSDKAVSLLTTVHGVSRSKIDQIPHGIHKIPASAGVDIRAKLNVKGPLILTFGLLSPDKGIHFVIQALPKIVEKHPDALYLVVGATHPNVIKSDGETYRESLHALAKKLGVEANVKFVDQFVPLEELVQYLGAMDIYVTPYLKPEQITSGTLAYAIGAGKAVISTPYWYAMELLAEGRGILVPFKDPDAIALAVLDIQADPVAAELMAERSAEYGRGMLWEHVGNEYLKTFARAKSDREKRQRSFDISTVSPRLAQPVLPPLDLSHLIALTDDTGIFQHATFNIPNRKEGYCVDDNCRALILTTLLENNPVPLPIVKTLQSRYLAFVMEAFNEETGRFRNFMSFGRTWLEASGSEDSHGRTLWALGHATHRIRSAGSRRLAYCLLLAGIEALGETTSPRTWAYAVLGADEALEGCPEDPALLEMMETMASRIWRQYEIFQSSEWPWFEDSLSYCNARLSQAMIVAGRRLDNSRMLEIGLTSLGWLMGRQSGPGGVFAPIGSDGFAHRDGSRAWFDQQPVEAAASVSACLTAYRLTQDEAWKKEAFRAFGWFLGENMLGRSLVDMESGGCCDGLHESRVNLNQGAESTLSYLIAHSEIKASLIQGQVALPLRGVPGLR